MRVKRGCSSDTSSHSALVLLSSPADSLATVASVGDGVPGLVGLQRLADESVLQCLSEQLDRLLLDFPNRLEVRARAASLGTARVKRAGWIGSMGFFGGLCGSEACGLDPFGLTHPEGHSDECKLHRLHILARAACLAVLRDWSYHERSSEKHGSASRGLGLAPV